MPTLHMGYMGSAKINGVSYFMSGSSLNPTQAVEAPDVVGGHEMKRGWVYGKVDITGNVTGPLHEGSGDLWALSKDRTTDGDHMDTAFEVELAFYKGGGYKFPNVVVNSLQISATAGEVVNFTADFAGATSTTAVSSSTAVTCSKLVTWDRVVFTASPSGSGGATNANYQSVTFTLNNNVNKAYVITDATGNLYAADLPCGVREITGTLSIYAEGDPADAGGGADTWCDYDATAAGDVNFQIDTACAGGSTILDANFKAVFHRAEGAGTTGLTIYTVNYTGVCDLT